METQNEADVVKPACPEGFDYRQLRFYLRSPEVPPAVWEHIQTCDVCQPKWKFLESTDPIIEAEFDARVAALAEQVTMAEIIFESVPPEQHEVRNEEPVGETAGSLEEAMARGVAERKVAPSRRDIPGVERIAKLKEILSAEFVVNICDRARSRAANDDDPQSLAELQALFSGRMDQELDRGSISQEFAMRVFNKVAAGAGQVPLSPQEVKIVAALPEMRLVTKKAPLLSMVNGKAFFNFAEFKRIRPSGAA